MNIVINQRRILYRCIFSVGLACACAFADVTPSTADTRKYDDRSVAVAAEVDSTSPSRTIRVLQRFMPTAGAMAVAWSPDGKLLATLGGIRGRVALWSPDTGTMIWEKAGNLGSGEALAFSNDGRLIIASAMEGEPEGKRAALSLLDVHTGEFVGHVVGPFPQESIMVNFGRKIALDRQRDTMAVISAQRPGRPVALYDMHDWTLKGSVAVPGDTPEAVAFAPDGSLAVGTIGGNIIVFNTKTRTATLTIETKEFIKSLAYSPNGRYVAVGFVGERVPIQIRSTTDGTLVRAYPGNLSDVPGIAWSPDGHYVASASFDKTVRLWSFGKISEGEIAATLKSGVWSVAFSPDGKLLAIGSSGGGVVIVTVK